MLSRKHRATTTKFVNDTESQDDDEGDDEGNEGTLSFAADDHTEMGDAASAPAENHGAGMLKK